MDLKALCTSASLFCTVFWTVTSSAVVLLMLLRIVLVSRSVNSKSVCNQSVRIQPKIQSGENETIHLARGSCLYCQY